MKEIEIGEYVRTDRGVIGKVIKKRYAEVIENGVIIIKYYLDNSRWTATPYIIKHSENIIDLIEIKDLIKFRNKIKDELENEEMIIHVFNEDTLEDIQTAIKDKEIEIVSVLTKEQFKNIEYRLEV